MAKANTSAPIARNFKNPAAREIDSEVGTLRLALQGLYGIHDDVGAHHDNRVSIEPTKAYVYETALGEYIRIIESAVEKLDEIASEEVPAARGAANG